MVSGTNNAYLRADVALPLAYAKMEPNLFWLDFVTPKAEDSNAFMYMYDSTGKSSDTKKKTPPPYTQGAQFPEVDKSRRLTTSALLESNGFSMRIGREVIRSNKMESELVECYDTLGYWLAEHINTSISTALIGGATASTAATGDAWGATTATPVEDLRLIKYEMRREGYPFRLTDVIVNTDNFAELEGYLTSIDVSSTKQQQVYGVPGGTGDSIFIPIAGCTVTGVDSGITESNFLAADKNNPAAELHYYIDTAFSQPRITYRTNGPDGKEITKTVPNLGLHFSQYEEPDTHDTIIQMWVENKTVVTKPYGLLYGAAKI